MSTLLDALPEAELGLDLRPLLRRANAWQNALRPTQDIAKQEMTALRESAFPVRTRMFDEEVLTFLLLHPGGTVVQIGAGVQCRCSRLDNGTAHWVEVDCGRCSALSSGQACSSERIQRVCAHSDMDAWIRKILALPGPHCFVFGSRPECFHGQELDSMIKSLREQFPGAWVVLEDATVSLSHALNEAQMVELLLGGRRNRPEISSMQRRLGQLGVIVDRSRTLLDHLDLLASSLPGLSRLLVPYFPGRYRSRFAQYQVLRVVLAQ